MNIHNKKVKIKCIVNVKKANLVKEGYKDFQDWASNKNHIYIGRDMSFYVPGTDGSIWQNPFPVAKSERQYKNDAIRYTLDESLDNFRKYIEDNKELISKLHELNNKVLGCWCYPSRCHGNVLAELVEKYCN
jgi:hypothetical protein